MEYIVCALIGYFLGCINPAYICGRLKGFDIRERGSMSAGASNAKICLGWPYFFLVAFYDISKAALAFVLAGYLFPSIALGPIAAGAMAVAGHCFPFYLNWQGGKGFAAFIGLSLVIDLKAAVIMLAVGLAVSLICNYIVVATVNQTVGFPIYMICSSLYSLPAVAVVALASCLILYKHRPNLKKFIKGEEIGINGKPVGIGRKTPAGVGKK